MKWTSGKSAAGAAGKALWIWIACFAVLMNALAPSISHAIAFGKGVPATWEICRADGTRVTISGLITAESMDTYADNNADNKAGKKPGGVQAMGGDCAYCQTHAGSFGLPPAANISLPVPGMQPYPFLFYRAPQPLAVWSAAQPRGPPAQI